MKPEQIKQFMIKSTLSNYLLIGVKLSTILFLTRLIFMGLEREAYGFWALLWSIFGYSLLLDFGFGTAIQKSTSETLETQNWKHYNQIISTAFFIYSLMGVGIAIMTLLGAYYMPNWFQFDSVASIRNYQQLFLLFGLGTAFIFPTGFFTEVLRGLQEITTRNYIQMTNQVLNLLLIWWVLSHNGGLMGLTLISLGLNLATNLTMAFFAKKKIPGLSIHWRNFRWKIVKGLISFSFFAYAITLTNLIIFRTDQIVISTCLSVSMVAGYQIASRIADMFRQLSTQLLDGLGPLTARLFVSKQTDQIRKTLIESNRIVGFISILFLVPLILHLQPLLKLWLHLEDKSVLITSYILLVSMWGLVTLRSTTTQVLLMCKKERFLMGIAVTESIANLILSITLAKYFGMGIIGVALGTLIPNILLSIFIQIPVACRFANISIGKYFSKTTIKPIISLMLSIGCCFPVIYFYNVTDVYQLILRGSLCTIITTVMVIIFALNKTQKHHLFSKIITQNFIKNLKIKQSVAINE